MPKAKDITGELGRLPKGKTTGWVSPQKAPALSGLERRPAFNAASFACWTLIFLFGLLQFVFLAWIS